MTNSATPIPRLAVIDAARGIALIAMTVFHFAFDLELFGIAEPGTINEPQWKYFARAIASSFLFLAGFSLYLACCQGIDWSKWRWRMAKILAAALVITIATWFATPDMFIFFGILHMIAFASIVGLVFVHLPWWITALAAVMVLVLRNTDRTELLDAPFWWWSGLSQYIPTSSDYVPVFPWLAPALIGIAAVKLCHQKGALEKLSLIKADNRAGRGLQFLGRHSLVYYLLHQPIMIALLLSAVWLLNLN